MNPVANINDAYMSRKALIELAQKREAELKARAWTVIQRQQEQLSGLTRLLGCIIEQTGELSYDIATEINEMHPGRIVLIERDGAWTVRLKDDADKPAELSLVPDQLPEEMIDREAMERDGVTECKTDAGS